MTKINWKIRAKNPTFWVQLVVSTCIAVLGYMGMEVKDLTSWQIVGDAFVKAIQTPYVWIIAGVIWYNALIDPTSTGITDSSRALNYTEPNGIKY